MRVELVKRFRFEAAHRLPRVPDGHKCARLHGHSYQVAVTVAGEVDPATGWLMDFAVITGAVEPVREQLDHRYLNELDGLDNPTSEVLARWIWQRVQPALPQLACVTVEETCTASCAFRGPGDAP